MFVTFEGCEGVGKSTQLRFLKEYVDSTAQHAVFVREPGGTEISEQIRRIILDTANAEMQAVTEAYLYASARAQLVREVIKPALSRKELVICDRFIDSSVAYQGYARGLGADLVKQINAAAIDGCMPDLTVFIDLRPENNFRAVKTQDRLEQESEQFHQKVYEGFVAEMRASNGRIIPIKPDFNKFRTHENIIALLRERGIIK